MWRKLKILLRHKIILPGPTGNSTTDPSGNDPVRPPGTPCKTPRAPCVPDWWGYEGIAPQGAQKSPRLNQHFLRPDKLFYLENSKWFIKKRNSPLKWMNSPI